MSNITSKADITWLNQLPVNWKIQKVKQVYNLQVGFTPNTKNDSYYSDEKYGFEWLTITDLTNDKIIPKSTEKHISKRYVTEFQPKIIKKGSLLYSFKLSLGQVAFADRDIYSNEAIASFEDSRGVCLPYLYYSSIFIEFNANENIYGAKILNQQLIKNAYVPVPPLPEQQAIANFLDEKCSKIDEAVAKQKSIVEKLKEYRQTVITEAVTKGLNPDAEMKETEITGLEIIPNTWSIKRMQDVATYKKGPFGSAIKVGIFVPKGLNTYKVYEQKNAIYHDENIGESYVKEEDYLRLRDFEVFPGDIIVSCAGTIGECHILSNNMEKGIINQALMKVTLNKNVNKNYFLKLFEIVLRKLGDENSNGSAIKNIPPFSVLKKYKIPYPPIEEQQQIVTYLVDKCSQIDEAITRSNAIVEKLEEYKKSVIYEYVTGKKEVPSEYYEV